MDFDKKILEAITDYARLLFSIEDVGIILEIDRLELRKIANNDTHVFMIAYKKGRLLTEAEVRKTAITMAKQGSTPAIDHVRKLLRDSEIKNL
jgi:hypothetical protein